MRVPEAAIIREVGPVMLLDLASMDPVTASRFRREGRIHTTTLLRRHSQAIGERVVDCISYGQAANRGVVEPDPEAGAASGASLSWGVTVRGDTRIGTLGAFSMVEEVPRRWSAAPAPGIPEAWLSIVGLVLAAGLGPVRGSLSSLVAWRFSRRPGPYRWVDRGWAPGFSDAWERLPEGVVLARDADGAAVRLELTR